MFTHLHPVLGVLGLLAGVLGASIGGRWPSRRDLALPVAVAGALLLGIGARPGIELLIVAAALLTTAALLPRVVGSYGAPRPLAWLPALTLPVVAAIYLSVPDTEGPVLLAAALVPVVLMAQRDGWRGPAATIAGWLLSLLTGVVAVTWFGSAGRFSATGWWMPKLVLTVIEIGLIALAARDFRSSAPERPPL